MISPQILQRLADLDGKLSLNEGIRLAQLARTVPVDRAIVEIGSFKGKSACYLGTGSRYGEGAPVYAVDLWELHSSPEYSSHDVFAAWREQVSQMDLQDVITPIRCDSAVLGKLFSQRVGLLFIDGDHSYESVASDFHAWSPQLVSGGVLVFHDYADEE